MARVTQVIHYYVTKQPDGLTISRNNNKITFSWKIGDANYGQGQSWQYGVNGKWSKWASLGGAVTSKTITVDLSTLQHAEFAVIGTRSSWSVRKGNKQHEYESYPSPESIQVVEMKPPAPPSSLTCTAQGNDNLNQATFTWAADGSTTNWNYNAGCTWESILIKDCTITSGANIPAETWKSGTLGWQTGTSAAAGGSATIIEDAAIASGSYTRWFRVKCRGGAMGDSDWVYTKHVYAVPFAATVTSAKFAPRSSGGGALTANWLININNPSRPVDSVALEYIIDTPSAGGAAPTSGNWTRDKNLVPTASGGVTIDISDKPQEDQGLFVRVVSKHDNRENWSAGYPVSYGELNKPTNFNVQVYQATLKADFSFTAATTVPGAFHVIKALTPSQPSGRIIAVVPNGETTATNVSILESDLTASTTFGIYAVVGTYQGSGSSNVPYAVRAIMQSDLVTQGGTVPVAPTGVTALPGERTGTIRVTWNWTWTNATFAELSWSDHEDAWESTDEPETYNVERSRSAAWNISGLETGKDWFIRVRLGQTTSAGTNMGIYSGIVKCPLASAPAVPVLEVNPSIITAKGAVECSWGYVTTDGTAQGSADVSEVITSGGVTTYKSLAKTTTQQTATITAKSAGWTTGETHYLVVKVASASGRNCDDWSAPVPVTVADPMTVAITANSLEQRTVTVDGDSRTFTALTEMPLTLTVTGAGVGNRTSVMIERAEAYHLERPDENVTNGYEGETIAVYTQIGEAPITITNDDLIGRLDDGAKYNIVATTQDSLGQSATTILPFEVLWDEQAIVPEASVVVDNDEFISKITLVAPDGATETARCDIYRLSVDKPVLVYQDAEFGETYVDPFPTIGEFGGHRIVYKTANGDYITDDHRHAWLDLTDADGDELDVEYNLIDWGEGRVKLTYNVDLSNTWSKDFTETKYLGGSVQGDWNPAVTRTGTIDTVAISTEDQGLISDLRRLAIYPGLCHIRTKDGSSYAANVDVSESYAQNTAHKIVDFSLKITRVDTQDLDGMTLDEWNELHPTEDDE